MPYLLTNKKRNAAASAAVQSTTEIGKARAQAEADAAARVKGQQMTESRKEVDDAKCQLMADILLPVEPHPKTTVMSKRSMTN